MDFPDPPKIPFAWQDLAEERTYAPSTAPTERVYFPFSQVPRGRLGALHQYPVYAGVLCGQPDRRQDNSSFVEHAIERAAELFGVEWDAVVVIPPVLQVGERFRDVPGQGRVGYTVYLLPPVCSMALFDASTSDPDEEEVGTRTAVVWFQKGFGLRNFISTGPLRLIRSPAPATASESATPAASGSPP